MQTIEDREFVRDFEDLLQRVNLTNKSILEILVRMRIVELVWYGIV